MTTLTSVDPNIRDHMTGVQLRLIKERLAQEKDRVSSRASTSSRMSTGRLDEGTVRLHQAMLRRQEIMEKLKNEERIREELQSGRHSSRRSVRYSPPPPPPPPAPHPRDGSPPHHVVEHQVRPIRLEPLPAPAPAPPMPAPQVIQMPQPMMYAPPGQPTNAKTEMMEMMVMQNAQMHNYMMQQMMMSNIPKPPPPPPQQAAPKIDLDDLLSLKSERLKRPKSVHHHHYSPPPPQPPPQQPYTLPPLLPAYTVFPPGYPYMSPRPFPHEVEPLKQPVARKKPKPKYKPPPFKYGPLPFPGPWALRKFRHAAYAAYFVKSSQKLLKLRKQGKRKTDIHQQLSPEFLLGVKLKEAVAAIHHIYLNEPGKVSSYLRRACGEGAKDLRVVLDPNNKQQKEALADLGTILENVAYEMTEIMPSSGVLGTHKKAVVYDMLENGTKYPRGYLWQIEKNLLVFDHNGAVVNIENKEAMVLLAGMYIGRALATTLCLRPVEYHLVKERTSHVAEANLKLLATLFIYMLRRVYTEPKAKQTVPAPFEIGKLVYKDDVMQPVYIKLKKNFDYAEKLLRQWGMEYAKRIRTATY